MKVKSRVFSRRYVSLRCPTTSLFTFALALALSSCNQGERGTKNVDRTSKAEVTSIDWLMFHGDRYRSGWNWMETVLTPESVSGGNFGKLWDTGELDQVTGHSPHLYASPLFVGNMIATTDDLSGLPFSVVIAATTNSYVYAINAFDANGIPAGTILWKNFLGQPSGGSDGGIPWGVLGTPAIDLNASPPRVYVVADTAAPYPSRKWRAFALDLGNGNLLDGWPLDFDDGTVGMTSGAGVQQNGPTKFQSTGTMSQRGGLNISWDSSLLYVPFGGYSDTAAGFLIAIDTGVVSGNPPGIVSVFASSPSGAASEANGGLWSSGGPAIDGNGNIYATTGNDLNVRGAVPGYWGESLLAWGPDLPLHLVGTYTPWNHCQMDRADTDLAGGAATVIDMDPSLTTSSHLIAFGGKQGNAYLIDRDNMPGRLDQRPPCHEDPNNIDKPLDPTADPADGSLFGSATYPWYRSEDGLNDPRPGPLSVFGPYHESCMNVNYARARSTPAWFQNWDGTTYVIFTGSTKNGTCSQTSISPSVARVLVNTPDPTLPAYLTIDAVDQSLVFQSPGSPVVSSNGADINTAIIWVLEPNRKRGDSLQGAYHPTLYAISARDMTPLSILYSSTPELLNSGGKYNHPIVANGVVFTGTDRISAFGLIPTGP